MSDAEQAPLRFDTARAPASAICSACSQPIASAYFTIGAQIACERCKTRIEAALSQPAGFSALTRSALFGSAAGIVGAAGWWALRVFADFLSWLPAIAVGYLVGRAVRQGSGGRGGLAFQLLAVAIAYFWVAANFVPDVYARMNEVRLAAEGAPILLAQLFAALAVSLALPFRMGFENAIGLLLIGFGLYQAWTLNRGVSIQIAGPFSLAPMSAAKPNA